MAGLGGFAGTRTGALPRACQALPASALCLTEEHSRIVKTVNRETVKKIEPESRDQESSESKESRIQLLAASLQGSSPAENWDFRMLNVALGNATTTNGSARTVNVGRPAAMAILRYGTRGPMQIRVVSSEGIQDQ